MVTKSQQQSYNMFYLLWPLHCHLIDTQLAHVIQHHLISQPA